MKVKVSAILASIQKKTIRRLAAIMVIFIPIVTLANPSGVIIKLSPELKNTSRQCLGSLMNYYHSAYDPGAEIFISYLRDRSATGKTEVYFVHVIDWPNNSKLVKYNYTYKLENNPNCYYPLLQKLP